ncbi:putative calcofluor white hypersensitive protein [Eutypa lata UCREL1]|uniref:Putative calcofluor white hypersensitive protein n=1 Tax=Eutypa lata (strain UCR-EL1) TaxID=1287681 RepID=M7SM66_EUTLA|nr:putative calcofluor white hypersensitive protein [Eutypa lata UCREL1]
MARSRLPLLVGVTAVGGVGYYLYQAGGEPKVAQRQAEADAHSVSSRLRSELPGRGKEAEKEAEKYGAQAGAKFDNATRAELSRSAAEGEAYAKNAKDAALKKVDEFDKKVEAEASKAKSGVSSWFGGGK